MYWAQAGGLERRPGPIRCIHHIQMKTFTPAAPAHMPALTGAETLTSILITLTQTCTLTTAPLLRTKMLLAIMGTAWQDIHTVPVGVLRLMKEKTHTGILRRLVAATGVFLMFNHDQTAFAQSVALTGPLWFTPRTRTFTFLIQETGTSDRRCS